MAGAVFSVVTDSPSETGGVPRRGEGVDKTKTKTMTPPASLVPGDKVEDYKIKKVSAVWRIPEKPPSVIRHQKSRAKRDMQGHGVLMPNHLSLMLVAQQVVDSLNRIEGGQGNLYHQGVPVAHSTIPQTWQFKGLEFAA